MHEPAPLREWIADAVRDWASIMACEIHERLEAGRPMPAEILFMSAPASLGEPVARRRLRQVARCLRDLYRDMHRAGDRPTPGVPDTGTYLDEMRR
jgi:hypothetical protein